MAEKHTRKGCTYLITGGSGSGKSGFAQRLAAHLGGSVAYLATGRPTTTEMAARIRKHQQARPADWLTVEAPRQLASALASHAADASVILLDDLPSLLSTCLSAVEATGGQLDAPDLAEQSVRRVVDGEVDAVVEWCAAGGKHLVLVTSETGSGVLPHDPLDRLFKDVLGRLNAHLAHAADGAFLVVAGMAVDVRALERETLRALGLPDRALAAPGGRGRSGRSAQQQSGRGT